MPCQAVRHILTSARLGTPAQRGRAVGPESARRHCRSGSRSGFSGDREQQSTPDRRFAGTGRWAVGTRSGQPLNNRTVDHHVVNEQIGLDRYAWSRRGIAGGSGQRSYPPGRARTPSGPLPPLTPEKPCTDEPLAPPVGSSDRGRRDKRVRDVTADPGRRLAFQGGVLVRRIAGPGLLLRSLPYAPQTGCRRPLRPFASPPPPHCRTADRTPDRPAGTSAPARRYIARPSSLGSRIVETTSCRSPARAAAPAVPIGARSGRAGRRNAVGCNENQDRVSAGATTPNQITPSGGVASGWPRPRLDGYHATSPRGICPNPSVVSKAPRTARDCDSRRPAAVSTMRRNARACGLRVGSTLLGAQALRAVGVVAFRVCRQYGSISIACAAQ